MRNKEQNTKRQKEGVSLIVLVITIIIMVILAGSIILTLNNSGIIDRANQAVDKTNIQQARQIADIAWLEGYADGLRTQEELQDYVDNYLERSNITNYPVYVSTSGVEHSITEYVDNVPIPRGFVASPYDDENEKDAGLVIYELNQGETAIPVSETQFTSWTTRNQYVWVPVDNFTTEFVRTYYGVGGGQGTLSNTLGQSYRHWEVTLDTTTNMPLATQDSRYMTATTLAEVQAMYASVKKHGGFYVARYEMGIDTQRTSKNESISDITVHSKMNKIPFTYLPWASVPEEMDFSDLNVDAGGAVEVARGIYPNTDNTLGVVSTLIYDVQWDTTINWIANTKLEDGTTEKYPNILTDSTDYGNYKNHTITSKEDLNIGAGYKVSGSGSSGYTQVTAETTISKDASTSWALTTGALKAAKTNNIYDMAGNMEEWTMSGFDSGREFRGGNFVGSADTVSFRTEMAINFPWNSSNKASARIALYIK